MNLLIGLLISVLGFIGSYFYGHHKGYEDKTAEDDVQIAKIVADNKAKEEKLNDQISDLSIQREREKEDAKKQIAKRDADIATGKLRLYVKTKSSCPTSPNAPASGGSDPVYAQLDPEVATSLTAITDDGDTQIRKLNACIATYETVRKMINHD